MRPLPGQRSGRAALKAVVVLLATALGVIRPVVAFAHGKLKSSAPVAGARLSTAPRELRLTFTETPELAVTTVELRGPNDATVALAPIELTGDGVTVTAGIRGVVVPGAYSVSWKMAGADGHPIRGRFAFTIVSEASATTPSGDADTVVLPSPRNGQSANGVLAAKQHTPSSEHRMTGEVRDDTEFGSESPGYVVIRWAQFVSLLLVLGALSFRFVVLRFLLGIPQQGPGSSNPLASQCRVRVAKVGLVAAVSLAVVAFLRAYAQSYAVHGRADALNLALIGTLIGHTLWGWGWLLQIAGVATTILGFWLARRAEGSGHEGKGRRRALPGWTVAALGGIALAFTPALSGHSASAPSLRSLSVVGDAVHVAGAAGWLGSLACVVFAGIPAALSLPDGERGEAVADLVNAFSPVGLAFAVVAAVTGVFAAWLQLGGIATLWQEAYGRILLLKLAVLSFVAATGAYNWLRVKPTLGDIEGAQRVRRSALTELAIALVVLLITAVLVATPPPGEVMSISAGCRLTLAVLAR